MIRIPRRPTVSDNTRVPTRERLLQKQPAAKPRLLLQAKERACSTAADAAAAAFTHPSDGTLVPPPDCKLDAPRLWGEERLRLGQYPRLVTTKTSYRFLQQHKNQGTGTSSEYVCVPVAPADDIEKTLCLGGRTAKTTLLRWCGDWAERKLHREIAKYEAVKEFWVFDYCKDLVMPGFKEKEEFCAGQFLEELQSPWVCAWLREFLGDGVMDKIEAAMRRTGEGQWKGASENVLRQRSYWESLCLRFKSDALLV